MSKPLPVIVRREGAHLVAFFPSVLGNSDDPRTMECYSQGEHSVCHAHYVGSKTKPASDWEVKQMLKHLHSIGYANLKAVSRSSSHHTAERRAQCRR